MSSLDKKKREGRRRRGKRARSEERGEGGETGSFRGYSSRKWKICTGIQKIPRWVPLRTQKEERNGREEGEGFERSKGGAKVQPERLLSWETINRACQSEALQKNEGQKIIRKQTGEGRGAVAVALKTASLRSARAEGGTR